MPVAAWQAAVDTGVGPAPRFQLEEGASDV